MPRFFVLSGPDLGKSFELGEGALFGRAPECAASLRSSSISRHHARLEREGEQWVIVDLGSRNGIQREGRRVERLTLTDGAVFLLGDVELRFRVQDEAQVRPVAIPPPPPPLPAQHEPPRPAPPAPLPAQREPPRPAPPARPSAKDAELDEIELEHVELDDAPRVDGVRSEPARGALPRAPAGSAPGATAPPPRVPREAPRPATLAPPRTSAPGGAVELRDAGRPVLQYSRVPGARGFALSDLGQQPLWVKLCVALVALALFAALFYVAFRGTVFLRERVQGEPAEVEALPE